MKRLNPKTGKPFKMGETREDGYFFNRYKLKKNADGYFQEHWSSPEGWAKYKLNQTICKKRTAEVNKQYVQDIKMSKGCACCGWKDHAYGLDFDHIKPSTKLFGLGDAARRTLEQIDAEIAKCIVLCSNCHRLKTQDPGEFARYWEMHHAHADRDWETTW